MINLMGRCCDPFLTDDTLLRKGIIMPHDEQDLVNGEDAW